MKQCSTKRNELTICNERTIRNKCTIQNERTIRHERTKRNNRTKRNKSMKRNVCTKRAFDISQKLRRRQSNHRLIHITLETRTEIHFADNAHC